MEHFVASENDGKRENYLSYWCYEGILAICKLVTVTRVVNLLFISFILHSFHYRSFIRHYHSPCIYSCYMFVITPGEPNVNKF